MRATLRAQPCTGLHIPKVTSSEIQQTTLKLDIVDTRDIQGGSNMTGTDLCVNKSQFVPVIFEPPCTNRGTVPLVHAEFSQSG
jgi:hypothetical protein